jgi:hypothetical protein
MKIPSGGKPDGILKDKIDGSGALATPQRSERAESKQGQAN